MVRQPPFVVGENHAGIAAPTSCDGASGIRDSHCTPPHARMGQGDDGRTQLRGGLLGGHHVALGSSGFLAKQALVSLIIPSRHGQDFVPDGGLFAKSATLRKAALAIGGACVLAAVLFFAAPPFRQAFQVALQPGISHPGISKCLLQRWPRGRRQDTTRKGSPSVRCGCKIRARAHGWRGMQFALIRTSFGYIHCRHAPPGN